MLKKQEKVVTAIRSRCKNGKKSVYALSDGRVAYTDGIVAVIVDRQLDDEQPTDDYVSEQIMSVLDSTKLVPVERQGLAMMEGLGQVYGKPIGKQTYFEAAGKDGKIGYFNPRFLDEASKVVGSDADMYLSEYYGGYSALVLHGNMTRKQRRKTDNPEDLTMIILPVFVRR